jgi:hypothetical protein
MKNLLAGLALAGTMMLAAPSAPAQPAANDADVRAAVACLAGRDANSFATLLRSSPLSHAERTEVGRLMPLLLRCREGSERFSATVIQLRAAVIDHLYAQQFATARAPRTPPLAVAPLLRVDQARSRSEAEPLAATYTLLECVTAAHPDLIRAYLATPAGSEAEQAGFRALFPGLAACLPANGSRQLALGGTRLRGVLAEMLYRWSVVQRDGPTSPFAAAPTPAG